MVTLTQLEYIVAVQRFGNFRQAAKSCFVTQPTLSMQIQKLEDELGVLLFDRSEQPIRATPIGEQLLEQAAIVLTHAARIPAIIQQARDSLEGDLRLGVIPTLAPYVLPLFVERFCRELPKVRLHVEESKTDDIIVALRKNQLDVGLAATPLDEPLIEEVPLFSEPFYVYADKDSALARRSSVTEAELKDERILLLTEGHCLRTQMVRVCGSRLTKQQKKGEGGLDFESGSIETLCRLVEQGLGYTVIPHLAKGLNTTRNGRVIPFAGATPSREVSLCVHASFARRGLLDALAEHIRAALPAELRKPDPNTRTIKLR